MTDPIPFAIAVAPNGARRTKADHPRLPMSAAEIACDAAEALEAGASMIHLHVRDRDGGHVLDVDLYREAIGAVRASVGDRLVIQATTEAVGLYSPQEQIALIDALRPESVSIALREILPKDDTQSGNEWQAASLFARMERQGILYQIIVYEAAELAHLEDLCRRGVMPDAPLAVLAVLGRYHEAGATAAELDAFMEAGIARHQWMLCAFGPGECGFMERAAQIGGHARVGFENNLQLPDGRIAPDNAAIVAATAGCAGLSGRGVANASDLRRLWRTPPPVTGGSGSPSRREDPNGGVAASAGAQSREGNSKNREIES